jgi:hypothetical protein
MKLTYKEGDWFAVPLGDGTFLAGRVARATKKGKVILGYFFGSVFPSVPSIEVVSELRPEAAIWVTRFGDLGLIRGEWPVIGQGSWDRATWAIPVFVSHNILRGRSFGRTYSDADPGAMVHESPISSQEAEGMWEDGVAGAGFVVTRLKRLVKEGERGALVAQIPLSHEKER